MAEKYLIGNGDDVSYELKREGERTFVRREGDDEWRDVSLERVGDSGLYLLMIDNHPVELYLERRRGGANVTIGRHQFNYDVGRWRPASRRASGGREQTGLVSITAPMTGSIVEVRCEVGQEIAAGEVLLVIESMKMNNELRAPAAGTIEAVPVSAGQRVQAGQVLVSINRSNGGAKAT